MRCQSTPACRTQLVCFATCVSRWGPSKECLNGFSLSVPVLLLQTPHKARITEKAAPQPAQCHFHALVRCNAEGQSAGKRQHKPCAGAGASAVGPSRAPWVPTKRYGARNSTPSHHTLVCEQSVLMALSAVTALPLCVPWAPCSMSSWQLHNLKLIAGRRRPGSKHLHRTALAGWCGDPHEESVGKWRTTASSAARQGTWCWHQTQAASKAEWSTSYGDSQIVPYIVDTASRLTACSRLPQSSAQSRTGCT